MHVTGMPGGGCLDAEHVEKRTEQPRWEKAADPYRGCVIRRLRVRGYISV